MSNFEGKWKQNELLQLESERYAYSFQDTQWGKRVWSKLNYDGQMKAANDILTSLYKSLAVQGLGVMAKDKTC